MFDLWCLKHFFEELRKKIIDCWIVILGVSFYGECSLTFSSSGFFEDKDWDFLVFNFNVIVEDLYFLYSIPFHNASCLYNYGLNSTVFNVAPVWSILLSWGVVGLLVFLSQVFLAVAVTELASAAMALRLISVYDKVIFFLVSEIV